MLVSTSTDTHGQSSRGWIGVDLDGTLAFYAGWKGPEHIGAPISPMVLRIKRWLLEGKEVRIFTARVSGPDSDTNSSIADLIQTWLDKVCGLPRLEVTCKKDYSMIELWDDRAVRVVFNTGHSTEETIANVAREFGSSL